MIMHALPICSVDQYVAQQNKIPPTAECIRADSVMIDKRNGTKASKDW